jgi:hypothetical protein
MDSGWHFVMKTYSGAWRRHRRLFAQHLNSTSARAFFDKQTTATHTLLRSLLRTPTGLEAHIRHAAADIILGIAYGYDIEPADDPFVELAERMVQTVGQGIRPGRYKVNVFPWCESSLELSFSQVMYCSGLYDCCSKVHSRLVSRRRVQSVRGRS